MSIRIAVVIIAVALILLAIAAYYYFFPALHTLEGASPGEAQKVDFIAENLIGKLAEIAKRKDFTSDFSYSLFNNGTVSFHVHAMQVGQFCPLHIHKNNEEADFIIQGKAKVKTLISGSSNPGSGRESREVLLDKNSIFFAPPGSAHEFMNASEEVLGCLVIQTPPFQGNLYVKEETVEKSSLSSSQNLAELADKMVGAGEGKVAVSRIGTLYNVESRLMRTCSPLDQNMAKGYDLIIIYFEGKAHFEIHGKEIALTPTYFLGIPAGTSFRIVPEKGAQDSAMLCFYLPP